MSADGRDQRLKPCAGGCGRMTRGTRCRTCHAHIPARERSGQYGRFQLRPTHLITSIPGATGIGGAYTTSPSGLDPATATRAARTVAAHSRDADECREFLAMLGIEVRA